MTRTVPAALFLGLTLSVFGASACGEEDRTLKVTNITPAEGKADGGEYVIIKGNRFIDDGPRTAKVYFGNKQGTVERYQSDNELVVRAPGGKPGEVVDVLVVFDPGGQLTIRKGFKFVEKKPAATVEDLGGKK